MVTLQYFFVERAFLGEKMQATSQDKEMAGLLGIPVALMIIAFFISFSGSTATAPDSGFLSFCLGRHANSIALKAFAASIIGGFGDVTGTILALALGVVLNFGAAYIRSPYKDTLNSILLVVFLLSRPQGLFGEKLRKRHDRIVSSRPTNRQRSGVPVRDAVPHPLCRSDDSSRHAPADDRLLSQPIMQASKYAVAVLGLTIVLGYTGQINLAQAAFFGLGAYSVAVGTDSFGLPSGRRCSSASSLHRSPASCWASPRCGSADIIWRW